MEAKVVGLIIPEKRRVGMLDESSDGEPQQRGMLVREDDDLRGNDEYTDRSVATHIEDGTNSTRAPEVSQDDALDEESLLDLVAILIPEWGDGEDAIIILDESVPPLFGGTPGNASQENQFELALDRPLRFQVILVPRVAPPPAASGARLRRSPRARARGGPGIDFAGLGPVQSGLRYRRHGGRRVFRPKSWRATRVTARHAS
jgi:hypothetical protein